MNGMADRVLTGQETEGDEEAEHGEHVPGDEADVIAQGIPPEFVGKTTDIVSRDWVGSGNPGPDDETLEEPDDEPVVDPAGS
jgi:hypothetical protein